MQRSSFCLFFRSGAFMLSLFPDCFTLTRLFNTLMKSIVWPWLVESFPGMLGRPFSFFPKKRPMEDLMLFFLAALLRESWLLLLLLGLLPWPSCRPDRLSTSKVREPWEEGTSRKILSRDEHLQSPPSDVSDVFVAWSVAGLPVQPHGAWRGGRGCLTADRGLVFLGGLWSSGTESWALCSFWMLCWARWKWITIWAFKVSELLLKYKSIVSWTVTLLL